MTALSSVLRFNYFQKHEGWTLEILALHHSHHLVADGLHHEGHGHHRFVVVGFLLLLKMALSVLFRFELHLRAGPAENGIENTPIPIKPRRIIPGLKIN